MPSSFSTNLRIELQATGENSSTWGTIANTQFQLLEAAIAGWQSIALSDANRTLSASNGAADESRSAMLRFTGTLTAARDITVPSVSKLYVIHNATTGGFALNIKTAAGASAVVSNGTRALVMCDGTDCFFVIANPSIIPSTSGANTWASTQTFSVAPVFTDATGTRTALALGSLATLSTINNANWSGTALAIGNGGTGSTTAAGARTNLGLGSLATANTVDNSVWSGTALAVANGGTGATTVAVARTNLGLGSLATANTVDNSVWSGTALSVANGGTGSTTAAGARTNLGIGSMATRNVTIQAGGSPSGGADGDIFLIY